MTRFMFVGIVLKNIIEFKDNLRMLLYHKQC